MPKYFMYYAEFPKEKFGIVTTAFGRKVRGL
jgi:hypothetical protein